MMKTAIIDLDSLLFAAAWGEKIPDGEGGFVRDTKGRLVYKDKTEEEISSSIDFFMTSILNNTKATSYIAYVKGKKTGTHRYQAKPDYKANRPKESPSWWEYSKSYIIEQWQAIPVDNIEVDDAVNIARLKIPNSFIVAIDKDLLNLEGIHYNWKIKAWVETGRKQAFEYFWRDMIAGQQGDGIKGLPKYGEAAYYRLKDMSDDMRLTTFNEYIKVFGEQKGIQEFYKNYTCLKILEDYEGFVVPEPVEYKNVTTEFGDLFSGV